MRAAAKSATVWVLALAVLAAAMIAIAADPDHVVTHIRDIQFDAYQILHRRPYISTKARSGYTVRVLNFDDAARSRFGIWPYSYDVLAGLISKLHVAGAAIVVDDAPLPAGLDSDAVRAALNALPSPSAALAGALAAGESVVGFTLSNRDGGPPPAKTGAVIFQGPAVARADIAAYARAVPPLARIAAASAGLGARNLAPDGDGLVRAMPLLFRVGNRLVPSLDAEVMRRTADAATLVVTTRNRNLSNRSAHTVAADVEAGALSVPMRGDGAMDIYFSGPNRKREISATALDTGKIAPGALDHAIVFIAPPGADVMTPLGREDVATLHAEAMENILTGTPLVPVNGLYGGLVFVLVVGIGIAALLSRAGLVWAAGLTAVAIVAAQAFTWFLFVHSRILFDSLNPSLALGACFMAGYSARAFEIARTRTRLRQAFAGSVPATALDRIALTPRLLHSDGDSRVVTCLACGVRGYEELAESFAEDPAGFTLLMSTVMPPLVDVAIAHGAMVEQFTGGGFLAYWNAPLDDPEHAIHACDAAGRMTVVLADINGRLSRERRFDGTAFEPVEIGIGVSTGRAVAGGYDAGGRFVYSVSGDCTALAERIRTLSGQYGPAVIVSDDTRKAAERGFAFLEVDFVACGPREEPIRLFAMLGNPVLRASPKFRALATFHEHIFQSLRSQQWGRTRELIAQCRKLSGASQKLYDLHLSRIRYFEDHPPGADWDGAFRPILR